MPITFGIYDFFSYFVPGLLYLVVFNEFLRVIGWKFINFETWFQPEQVINLLLLVPVILVAYIIGHLLDVLAFKFFFGFVFRIRNQRGASYRGLEFVKENYPTLKVKFEPKDWNVMFTILRQRNKDISQVIDQFQANSIMLRNIAFGMLLLSVIYIGESISIQSSGPLIFASVTFVICGISIYKSRIFRTWFFEGVFEAALEYGASVKEVVEYTRNQNIKKNTRAESLKKR